MRKRERQATIQRLIQSEPIERQEDLVARLTAVETLIEQLDDRRIFATISGDASILIICRSAQYATDVLAELEAMVG